MASSVTVNINARDMTRGGVRNLRRDIQNLRRTLPPDHTIYVNLNDDLALRQAGRLRRNLNDLDDVTVRVNALGPDRADRHRLTRTLTRSLISPFRIMGRTLGGVMSDGLGQGIIGAFQAAGPIGMAVLAAIILSTVSVLGAALSGLLVTALGLGFVGVAGVSAAMSKQVKEQWKETLASLKENFREVGEPLIPVLDRALEKLTKLGDKIAPVFKKAMESATPATNAFIDKLFEGIERMGKAMFQPIMDAWNVFAPVFGDVLADSMEMWGESFADMAKLVREHSKEIELALRVVMKVIDLIIDTVTFLGEVWIWTMQSMGDALGFLIKEGVRPLVSGVLDAFGAILGAATSAFGWVPGLGDQLKGAQRDFGTFKEDVNQKLHDMGVQASSFDDKLNEANRTRVLKADIRSWQHDLDAAKEKLKSVPKSKRADVKANIQDLQRKIDRANHELGTLRDRTVHVWVKSHWDNQVADYFRASGGNVGAPLKHAATGGNRGNQVMVGEHGPEIVDLPGGSHVRSNSDTRRFMAQQGGGAGQVILRIEAGNSGLDQLLLQVLRNSIRVEGGNVQYVLGTKGR